MKEGPGEGKPKEASPRDQNKFLLRPHPRIQLQWWGGRGRVPPKTIRGRGENSQVVEKHTVYFRKLQITEDVTF